MDRKNNETKERGKWRELTPDVLKILKTLLEILRDIKTYFL